MENDKITVRTHRSQLRGPWGSTAFSPWASAQTLWPQMGTLDSSLL